MPQEKSRPALVAVTGSQPPYLYDLPQLLSLPQGFEFRFRYRRSWAQEELRKKDDIDHKGRDLFLLFHSQETGRVIPLRRAKIIQIEPAGPLLFVRFRLLDYAKIDLDLDQYSFPKPSDPEATMTCAHVMASPHPQAAVASTALAARALALLGDVTRDSKFKTFNDPLPSGWYLREAGTPQVDAALWEAGHEAWARLVAVMHGEKHLCGVPFFHVLHLRTDKHVPVAVVEPASVENRGSLTREDIHGFSLTQNERYCLRILEWCERPQGAPHPRIRLKCEFNEDQLTLEGSSSLVVGRYDIVEFTFKASRPGFSEVEVSAEPLDHKEGGADAPEAEQPWATWPTTFAARVPIVIKRTFWSVGRLLLAAVAGITLYLFAPEITSHAKVQGLLELLGLMLLFLPIRPLAEHVILEKGLGRLGGGGHH
jgi:hypothetical protein